MKILTFTLNDICFGIPIKNVEFMEPIEDGMNIHKMSGTPGYIKGLALIHDMSMPVYDLDSMFGFTEREFRQLIVIKVNGMKLAFEVEGEGEIVDAEEKTILTPPECIGTSQHYLKNIVTYRQKQLIFLIDVNRLVP